MAYRYEDPIANAVDSFTRLRTMQIDEENSKINRQNAISAQVLARAENRRKQETHDLDHKQKVQAYEDAEFRKEAAPVLRYLDAVRNGASPEELDMLAPAAFDRLSKSELLRPFREEFLSGRAVKDPKNTYFEPLKDPNSGRMAVGLRSPTGTGVLTENGTDLPDDPVMTFDHNELAAAFDSVYASHNGGEGYFAQLDAEKRAFTEFGKATDEMSYQSPVEVSSLAGGGSSAMATPGQYAVANTTPAGTGASPPPASPATKRLAQLDDDLTRLRAAKEGASPVSDIPALNMNTVSADVNRAGRRSGQLGSMGLHLVPEEATVEVNGVKGTYPTTAVRGYYSHNELPTTAPNSAHFGNEAAKQAAATPDTVPDTSAYDQKIAQAEAERNALLEALPAEQRQGSGATAALSQYVEQSMTPGQRQLVVRIASGQVDPKRVSPERRAQVAQLMVKAGKWNPEAATNFIQSGSVTRDVYAGHEANAATTREASAAAAQQANATANLEQARWIAPQAQASIAADYARVAASKAQARAAGAVDPYEVTARRIKFEESLVDRIVDSTGIEDKPRAAQTARALLGAIEAETGGDPEMMRRLATDAYVLAPMMARMEAAADGDIGSIDKFARTAIRAVYRDGDKAGIFGPDGQIDEGKLEAYLLGIANGR